MTGIVVAATVFQRDRIGELPEAATALLASRPGCVAVVAGASVVSYLMASFTMVGSVGPTLPFGKVLLVQVATGATTWLPALPRDPARSEPLPA